MKGRLKGVRNVLSVEGLSCCILAGIALVIVPCRTADAETYHIRADGIQSSKENASSCASPSTAMGAGNYQNNSFSAGDRIVFCHEGGIYRSTIYLREGGSTEAPIILDGRGTAVFSGSNIVSNWTQDSGNIWRASFNSPPQQVFIDSKFGNRKANKGQLQNNQDWYWVSNSLFLYSSAGDPDFVYNSPGIEAGVRSTCIGFGGQDHVVIQGLTVRHTNFAGITGYNPGANVTLKGIVAEWNWEVGINVGGPIPYHSLVIEDSIARNNGVGGIGLLNGARNSTIRRNRCHANGKHQSVGNEYSLMFQWTYGIKLWENGPFQEGNQIYDNVVFDNGRVQVGDDQGRGVGIWLDGLPGNPNNLNVIRNNLVHDNTGNGIFLELSGNTLVQANVLYGNATNTYGSAEFTPASIAIDARGDSVSENILVFNNTSVGGRCGIKVTSYACYGCWVRNNIVKNNIIVGASEHNLFALFGGDNDGEKGSGNIYDNNNFGPERPGFIRWGWTEHGTYAAWETAYGLPSHSVVGDPQFAGISPTSLYLTSDSPCRDSGVNLGLDFSQGLAELTQWPGSVQGCDQNSNGTGWEVGAFCYSGAANLELIFASNFDEGDLSKWTAVTDP